MLLTDKFDRYLEYTEELKLCDKFFGGKMEGIKGYGYDSIAFNAGEGVAKLSFEPNTPKKPMPYDITQIKRNLVQIKNSIFKKGQKDRIFMVLQENGESWVETKIAVEDEQKLKNKILGFNQNVKDFAKHQIAKIDGEPFLVDVQCVCNRFLWTGA